MPTSYVNLDALIKRQDMEATDTTKPPQTIGDIRHPELDQTANTYHVLRKPDFQRETSIWTPEKVKDLVVAYVNEDLVPAIILWRSPSNDLFVIDGAHRLSSLIAWVNDDYGDGLISRSFFDDITKAQKETHQKTKDLVEDTVGPYRLIADAFKNQGTPQKYIDLAKRLAHCSIKVQPLLTPNVTAAERSFFKINEQGVALSATEVTLLHSRNCPNAIAARAVNQRGTGHPHWHKFNEPIRNEIQKLAQQLYESLFEPAMSKPTIKTTNLPICGKYSYASSLGHLLSAINLANKVPDEIPRSKELAEQLVPPDSDGSRTLEYLKKTKKVINRIANRLDTDYSASLDLHPMVYFYSESGRHQPSVFLAVVEFFTECIEKDKFKHFTKIRARFEDFLIQYKDFLQQISRKNRGELRAVHALKAFFVYLMKELEKSRKTEDILKAINTSDFKYLKLTPASEDEEDTGPDFSPSVKSQNVIKVSLEKAEHCAICGARLAEHSVSFDHSQDKKYGGKGSEPNIAWTHHYCNSAKDILIPYLETDRAETESANA